MRRCKGDNLSYPSDNRLIMRAKPCTAVFIAVALALVLQSGCKSPMQHRQKADKVAYDVIGEKQLEALGYVEGFTIVRYSNLLRYRLLEEQNLLYSDKASLGANNLDLIEHWPDPNYLMPKRIPENASGQNDDLDPLFLLPDEPLRMTLHQALQIGARNNFEYQRMKESVFEAALDLDLARHFFRTQYSEVIKSRLDNDNSGNRAVTSVTQSSDTTLGRNFKNGLDFSANLGLDIVNLLTMGGASSLGLTADASISIPLLQGSGKHIVTEPLTQAERNAVYAIHNFERHKRTFAVNVADTYLRVLSQLDRIDNAEENYRRLVVSVRRSRRLADAGQLREIQVDQAVQDQLSAREGWITAQQSYQNALDQFKITLGLPVDADIELDPGELDKLVKLMTAVLVDVGKDQTVSEPNLPADAPVTFEPPGWRNPGPLEIDSTLAVRLALDNRLDLRNAQGRVYDAQRAVIVDADKLRAKLDLGASMAAGNSDNDAEIRLDRARWAVPITLDLPLERTAERYNYRKSLISLEQEIRNLGGLEDAIKQDIRSQLRNMLATRERLQIQAQGVLVAEKRVDSTNLFFEAGNAEIRDVLESQRSLLSAQNSLTSAVVSYRIAELTLQRDMGLLKVDETGLWREFNPEDIK
ncbi:MAG: TolC family protein [Planctomycetes bacterium]|nr:TolC family protein [Planctomycetota bacterium]